MDEIKVGLDFGTHQTKICIQRTPDEGHGEPIYEFLKFKDLDGKEHYLLPSVVQINGDDTLSYGFVEPSRERTIMEKPELEEFVSNIIDDVESVAQQLFDKYAQEGTTKEDVDVLLNMLEERNRIISEREEYIKKLNQKKYEEQMAKYRNKKSVYRYFKQATFAERPWEQEYDHDLISIWYLAYVIFLLEERYGANFSINMGVPAGEKTFKRKHHDAISILASAYRLVEDVFENDMDAYLRSTVDELKEKTQIVKYSSDLFDEYNIRVFPEAFASLISLTSRGKLTQGMSLTADIGGGTTDVTFFTVSSGKPRIYRYWSIPCGLNYIAEKSGFDYSVGNFEGRANRDVINNYNTKKQEIVKELIDDLVRAYKKETQKLPSDVHRALKDRILVYTGGGSIYSYLTNEIYYFTDLHTIDENNWKEENIIDKDEVTRLCQILTTSYGLSMCQEEDEVQIEKFTTLFKEGFKSSAPVRRAYVSKDSC